MDMSTGGIFAIFGSLLSAGAQINESQDRAYVLEDEANAADQSARLAEIGGAYNAKRQSNQAEKVFGGIQADYAASGVSQDSGSALDVLRESHMNAELDRQNILYGAQMTAFNYRNKARAARFGAESAIKAGRMNAFASVFGGAAKAADYGAGSKSTTTTNNGLNADGSISGGGWIPMSASGNEYWRYS
jgi:hypothetical protein